MTHMLRRVAQGATLVALIATGLFASPAHAAPTSTGTSPDVHDDRVLVVLVEEDEHDSDTHVEDPDGAPSDGSSATTEPQSHSASIDENGSQSSFEVDEPVGAILEVPGGHAPGDIPTAELPPAEIPPADLPSADLPAGDLPTASRPGGDAPAVLPDTALGGGVADSASGNGPVDSSAASSPRLSPRQELSPALVPLIGGDLPDAAESLALARALSEPPVVAPAEAGASVPAPTSAGAGAPALVDQEAEVAAVVAGLPEGPAGVLAIRSVIWEVALLATVGAAVLTLGARARRARRCAC